MSALRKRKSVGDRRSISKLCNTWRAQNFSRGASRTDRRDYYAKKRYSSRYPRRVSLFLYGMPIACPYFWFNLSNTSNNFFLPFLILPERTPVGILPPRMPVPQLHTI